MQKNKNKVKQGKPVDSKTSDDKDKRTSVLIDNINKIEKTGNKGAKEAYMKELYALHTGTSPVNNVSKEAPVIQKEDKHSKTVAELRGEKTKPTVETLKDKPIVKNTAEIAEERRARNAADKPKDTTSINGGEPLENISNESVKSIIQEALDISKKEKQEQAGGTAISQGMKTDTKSIVGNGGGDSEGASSGSDFFVNKEKEASAANSFAMMMFLSGINRA